MHILVAGDLLAHPSLHDSGGWACLEAMAAGCPVVCFDLGGPATQVTEDTGIRVSATSPDQAVELLSDAFWRLGTNPQLRFRMGQAGKRRVRQHYSWEQKGELQRRLYLRVLAEADSK